MEGECRGDIVFILDSSGSIGDFNWHIAKQFAIDVMRGLKVGANQSHIGAIIYSPKVKVIFNLTQYDEVADIEDNMWSMPYISGTTNTADALEALTVMVKVSRWSTRPHSPGSLLRSNSGGDVKRSLSETCL